MMPMRHGSCFSGYGGLDVAIESVLDAETTWFVENDQAPSKILAHHWPSVPNYGDITTIKWTPDCPMCGPGHPTRVTRPDLFTYRYLCMTCQTDWPEDIRHSDPGADRIPAPVEILSGGSPCQDLSAAGKRAGMTEGTRSNLWVAMREGIAQLRPTLVVWENVRGAYSTRADSELESRPGLLDGVRRRDGEPVLRALGRVLGDLSDLGYVGGWHGLPASDLGAPHGRFRVFVVAYAKGHEGRIQYRDGAAAAHAQERDLGTGLREGGAGRVGWGRPGDARGAGDTEPTPVTLLPTPRATDGPKGSPNQKGSSGDVMLSGAVMTTRLLPTPTTQDGANTAGPSQFERNSVPLNALVTLLPTPAASDDEGGKTSRPGDRKDELLLGGIARELGDTQRLLPTPVVSDAESAGAPAGQTYRGVSLTDATVRRNAQWGIYADAIARWEALAGPAPAPTQPTDAYRRMVAKRKAGKDKRPVGMRGSLMPSLQLSPAFSEWMMGLVAGHVTGVPDLTRNEMLKAIGNGVVPPQAAAALRHLLAVAIPREAMAAA